MSLLDAVLGDLPAFKKNPIQFLEDRSIGKDGPTPVRFGPMRAYVAARPSVVREVMVTRRDEFEKGAEQARMRPVFGDGMITATGSRWHAAREATKVGFSSAGLQEGLHLAMRCVATEASDLASCAGELVMVHRVMARLAMRMAAGALLHVQLEDSVTDILYDAASIAHERLSDSIYRVIDFDAFLPTRKNRRFRRAIKGFEHVADDFVRQPKGILELLGPVADKFGRRVLIDEAITMLVAGFETTAAAACWLTYTLACRPDLVAWLRPEADAAFGPNWLIDPAALREMPRAKALVQEVLRLYPSGWWFARRGLRNVVLDGVLVKKGTSVIIGPWALHRQPDFWPSPLTLDPWRFFEKPPPEKFSYIPFGAGARACVGQHLAMAELTAIAAMLVSAFDLEPLSGPMENLTPFGGVTLSPPHGMAIRLQLRPQLRKVA